MAQKPPVIVIDRDAVDPALYSEEQLCEATKHLHRDLGLKQVKRVGADVIGKNHKQQVVVTHVDRAAKHARFLDENPHAFDEPAAEFEAPADETEPAA